MGGEGLQKASMIPMFTITRPPVSRHFPDDDMPRIPELSPLDSPQARRAARLANIPDRVIPSPRVVASAR